MTKPGNVSGYAEYYKVIDPSVPKGTGLLTTYKFLNNISRNTIKQEK